MTTDDKNPAETEAAEALRRYLDDAPDGRPRPPEADTVDHLRDAADDAVIARAWSRIALEPRTQAATPSGRRWMPLVAMAAAALLVASALVVLEPGSEPAVPFVTAAELDAASSALADADISPGRRLARLQAATDPARRRLVRRLTDG